MLRPEQLLFILGIILTACLASVLYFGAMPLATLLLF
jgi:hypothetical protein